MANLAYHSVSGSTHRQPIRCDSLGMSEDGSTLVEEIIDAEFDAIFHDPA